MFIYTLRFIYGDVVEHTEKKKILESYYTYYDIAEKLNIGVDTVRRHVNKVKKELELNPVKQKTISSKGSLLNCLSTDDTNTFINYFETKEESNGENDLLTTSRYGFFYIIQLIPEFNPNRVKIGFADNVEKRLKRASNSFTYC